MKPFRLNLSLTIADSHFERIIPLNLRRILDCDRYRIEGALADLSEFCCALRQGRILIGVALRKSDGLKQDAAKLLGWGRNTLTRKMKELGMES